MRRLPYGMTWLSRGAWRPTLNVTAADYRSTSAPIYQTCVFWLAEEEPAPGGFLSYTAAAPPPTPPVVSPQHQPPTPPPGRPAHNQHVSNGGPAPHVPPEEPDDYKEYQKRV